jgi:sarcosine oxidase subunit gamma
VSAPEAGPARAPLELRPLECDLVELAAYAGAAAAPAAPAALALPAPGRLQAVGGALLLAVRPARTWHLGPRAAPGATRRALVARAAGAFSVVDLSSAYEVLELAGARAAELLARGCRLDLGARAFGPGRAAATTIAQVTVTLARTPRGYLLLAPASYARHLTEWLVAAGRPFGLALAASLPFPDPSGDPER